jgi:hypothetical protein
MEYRFESHFLNLKGFYNPFTDEIWVNGKYHSEELEPLIEDILTHEHVHRAIANLEGNSTSESPNRSQAVELKELGGKNGGEGQLVQSKEAR